MKALNRETHDARDDLQISLESKAANSEFARDGLIEILEATSLRNLYLAGKGNVSNSKNIYFKINKRISYYLLTQLLLL